MTADLSHRIALQPFVKDLNKTGIVKWLTRLLVLGLVVGGGYTFYRQAIAILRREAARRDAQTVPVERLSFPITVVANKPVQAERSINVSPKTSGKLKSLLVKGDKVKQSFGGGMDSCPLRYTSWEMGYTSFRWVNHFGCRRLTWGLDAVCCRLIRCVGRC